VSLALARIEESAIAPALRLLPKAMSGTRARVILLAIGLQESRLEHRYQKTNSGRKGPARGLWQFESGSQASRGGVWGVYLHSDGHEVLRNLCRERDCGFDPRVIWAQLEYDDVLAAGVARILLWTDPKPLPELGEPEIAWDYYYRNWKPGKPHPDKWPANYEAALNEVFPQRSVT
jgi:hypothetical protein